MTGLWEKLTGTPWKTTRSAAAEFGPPPGARYARDLEALTNTEVAMYGEQVVARAQARKVPARALTVGNDRS